MRGRRTGGRGDGNIRWVRKEENGKACGSNTGDRSSLLLVRMKEKVCVRIRLEKKGMRSPMKGDGGHYSAKVIFLEGAKNPCQGLVSLPEK